MLNIPGNASETIVTMVIDDLVVEGTTEAVSVAVEERRCLVRKPFLYPASYSFTFSPMLLPNFFHFVCEKAGMVEHREVALPQQVEMAKQVLTRLGDFSAMSEEDDDLVSNIRALGNLFVSIGKF